MQPSDGPPLPASGATLRLARLFSPRWLVVRGCVLRGDAFHPAQVEEQWRATGGDTAAIEAALNRVSLRQEVSDGDLEILAEVAELLARAWLASLRDAFPERRFAVTVDPDGATVTASSHPTPT